MTYDSGTSVVTFPFVNAAEVITLGTILPIFCINAVALRFYTRKHRKVGVALDDWLMLPGLVLYIGMCICMLVGAANNVIGYDSPDNKSSAKPIDAYLIPDNPLFAKLLFAFQLMLTVSYGFVKCSIVVLYRRIFVTARNSAFDIACKVTMGVIIAWSLTFFIMTIVGCGPSPSTFWSNNPAEKTLKCQRSFAAGQGLASSDLILDFILMILPQPLVWSLQLGVWKKVVVSGIIAMGCSCVGASIARIVLFSQLDRAADLGLELDQNQIVTLSMYYSALDGGLAVIAACLTTLRPLFKGLTLSSVVNGVKSSFRSSSSSSGSRGSRLWRFSKPSMDVEHGSGGYKSVDADMEKQGSRGSYTVGAKEVSVPLMDQGRMPASPLPTRPPGYTA